LEKKKRGGAEGENRSSDDADSRIAFKDDLTAPEKKGRGPTGRSEGGGGRMEEERRRK